MRASGVGTGVEIGNRNTNRYVQWFEFLFQLFQDPKLQEAEDHASELTARLAQMTSRAVRAEAQIVKFTEAKAVSVHGEGVVQLRPKPAEVRAWEKAFFEDPKNVVTVSRLCLFPKIGGYTSMVLRGTQWEALLGNLSRRHEAGSNAVKSEEKMVSTAVKDVNGDEAASCGPSPSPAASTQASPTDQASMPVPPVME